MTALIGIDCATQPARVGLALGEMRGGVVRVLECTAASNREPPAKTVAGWLARCDGAIIALDAPLGWARALGASTLGHAAGMAMGATANAMFRRATDEDVIARIGKRPLEVGANLISRTAVAALDLLEEIRRLTGHTVPLAWGADEPATVRAIEVYPAATRIAHGAPDEGGSLEGLEAALDCSVLPRLASLSDDAVDAIVCALAAADFLRGEAVPPSDPERAAKEGWIWVRDRQPIAR